MYLTRRFWICLLASFLPALACESGLADEPVSFRTMTWNIWHGGREDGEKIGPQRVVDIIKRSGADIVAMQETYGSGEWISEQLGFHFHPRGTNVSIHSRYPVLEDISVFEEFKCVGALLELPGNRKLAFYSIWLPYNSEIWMEGTRDVNDLDAMRAACDASRKSLEKMWALIQQRLSDSQYEGVPIVIAGDFNSMSHLDYIAPFQDQFDGVVIDWPTSHILSDVGFRDAYRQAHPEVNRQDDRTWTPRFPEQQQDRIDFIYYRGSQLELRDAAVIDEHDQGFPSDHAAVVSDFVLAKPKPSQKLRLVTYNIKHGLGNDGRVDLDRTAALLNNLHADFIALQEVDNQVKRSGKIDQAQALGKSLNRHAAFGSFMDYQGGEYGLGLLSKHPIVASQEIRLPTGNEPRVALACRIQLPDQREIMVVNLHFDWVKDDKFRFQQAQELASYLNSLTLPYVLMGDFNDQPQSRTLDLLSRGSLAAVKPNQDRFTFSSTAPTKEIDFIFAAPKKAWQLKFIRVLNGKLTSDHRPVLAVVELNP